MSSGSSQGVRRGGWSGASGGWAARSGTGRIGADEAATLAVRAVRTLDCAELRRLFRDASALSFHKLDDRTLARRLAHAIVRGEAQVSGGDEELAPQWVSLPGIEENRALLSTAEIVPGLDLYPIEDEATAARVAALLLGESIGREFLLDYLDAEDDARDGVTVDVDDEAAICEACAELLFRGELNLHTPRIGEAEHVPAPIVIAPRAAAAAPKETRTDHWIEIVLKDEDGEPVADEPYRITLPGGEVRSGLLDDQGKARLDGLKDGGSAQVAFPQIDGREWRLA